MVKCGSCVANPSIIRSATNQKRRIKYNERRTLSIFLNKLKKKPTNQQLESHGHSALNKRDCNYGLTHKLPR